VLCEEEEEEEEEGEEEEEEDYFTVSVQFLTGEDSFVFTTMLRPACEY
jgi:hypothetical protein